MAHKCDGGSGPAHYKGRVEFDLRPVGDDEIPAFARAVDTAFGVHATDELVAFMRSLVELDRTLAVVEGGDIVAGAGALSVELTLPGLTTLPAAAVTEVGVLPTHRRRGLLTALMRRQLDDVAERGEPVAVLGASESTIYGRFGYGCAALCSSVEIEAASLRPIVPSPAAEGGSLRFVDADVMAAVLPGIHERYRLTQPGEVSRSAGWWDAFLLDPELYRGDAGPRFAVVYVDATGRPAGYVTYRVQVDWLRDDDQTLFVEDLVGITPQARVALWRYCISVDLITRVRASNVPVDDPFGWTLPDPRRFAVTEMSDLLWLRLVDLPAALSARRYPAEGSLVFEVVDRFRPAGAGRYRLEAGRDGAECRRTAAHEPDLALDVTDLGAAYLGGVRLSTLGRAGRVAELRAGALERADALFACSPMPWCSTDF